MTNRAGFRVDGVGDDPSVILDAVRGSGAEGLLSAVALAAEVAAGVAKHPGELFASPGAPPAGGDAPRSVALAHVLEQITDLSAALDVVRARAEVALADALRTEKIAEARARTAQESDRAAARAVRAAEGAAHRIARQEIAFATRRSPATASRSLTTSRRFVEDMPQLRDAVVSGQVDPDDAAFAVRACGVLDPEQAQGVDSTLAERLPELSGAGRDGWRQELRTVIEKVCPSQASRRFERARRTRHVTVRPGMHGMATISAYVPAHDAQLAMKRLRLEAERLSAEGDDRGYHPIMADRLLDAVQGKDVGMEPVTLELGIILTDRALLCPERGETAEIEGYGAVPLEAVREPIRDALSEDRDDPFEPEVRAVFRRLYTHPVSGELVAAEARSRTFPAGMRRFVNWRDRWCRGPRCNATVRHVDHVIPFATGGETSLANGQGLCAACNQKEQHTATVEPIGTTSGTSTRWTSCSGIVRETRPARYTPPAPSTSDAEKLAEILARPDESRDDPSYAPLARFFRSQKRPRVDIVVPRPLARAPDRSF